MVTTLVGIGQAILQVKMVVVVQHVITVEHMGQTNARQIVESLLKDGKYKNNFK